MVEKTDLFDPADKLVRLQMIYILHVINCVKNSPDPGA